MTVPLARAPGRRLRARRPRGWLSWIVHLPIWPLAIVGQGLCSSACSNRYVQTAQEPAGSGGSLGSAGGGTGANSACSGGLRERFQSSTIELEEEIRYRRRAYDNIAMDERIAFAVAPDGSALAAWLDNAGSEVHITPLSSAGSRRAPDVVIVALEVGGLIARPDGFMLLSRGSDPGEPLIDPNHSASADQAALLTRFRGASRDYTVALTGTAQVTNAPAAYRRDCATTDLKGRLAFNGHKYGAYFAVHGCAGHPAESYYGDKLVYIDDEGALVAGGWSWNCSISEGLQLLPNDAAFAAFCLATDNPFPGLNQVTEGASESQLAPEAHTAGYVGGQFGGAVKMGDGSYVVTWLSRGGPSAMNAARANRQAPDIALMQLASDYSALTPVQYLTNTPDVAENNLHLAPYGPDRLLLIWDRVEEPTLSGQTSFGQYAGTYAQLILPTGEPLSDPELIPAPPNSQDDIVVHPNGDLGFAYVPDDARDYANVLPLDSRGVPAVAARRSLGIARIQYCK